MIKGNDHIRTLKLDIRNIRPAIHVINAIRFGSYHSRNPLPDSLCQALGECGGEDAGL